MKQINNYWIDENSNEWNCDIFTNEQAEKYSKTLIGCTDCRGCINCTNCTFCRGCTDCTDCRGCTNCRDCINCTDCRGCTDCTYCRGCRDCTYFYSQPTCYMTKKIGSRKAITYFYKYQDKIYIVCGCFMGTLEEFKERVLITHKDNDIYKNEYLNEIEKVKKLFIGG